MNENKKEYFPNLDGLRFICFLLVFLHHSFHTEVSEILNSDFHILLKRTLFVNGNLGVNFFFVLSGFLITYLLIREKQEYFKIAIVKFWIRRILRIWPLYFFCVFFGFFIFPFIKSLIAVPSYESATILSYLSFTSNFELISKGLPDASVLGVLWSIAIEEQFYLIWPIILSVFPVKRFWIVFTIIILFSLVFRALNLDDMVHEYHTLSCIGDMAIGGFGAWLAASYGINYIQNLKRMYILILYILVGLVFIFRKTICDVNIIFAVVERSIIACLFLLIILEQNYAKFSFFKLGYYKQISYLGRISYGLYSLHFIGILIVITITKYFGINTHLWQVVFLETILALVMTIFIAHFSYKYYESFFLKIKERFSY